jgi:tetratricopeptide (TPR) repeat protein
MCVGRLGEARAGIEESLALARLYGDVDNEVFALEWLAECCLELGDLDAAFAHARDAVAAAEKLNSQIGGVSADRFLGGVLLAQHRSHEASVTLERALATAREQGTGLHVEADFLQLLAAAHHDDGQTERARAECVEAIAVARRSCTPLFECDAQLVLARILMRGGAAQSDAAARVTDALDRAEALIVQIGAESRRPRLLELRAQLAHSQGDAAACERFLREAERALIEMGAPLRAQRLASDWTNTSSAEHS